jgi:hypothetical protein
MNTHSSLVDCFLAYTKSFFKPISTKLMDIVLFIYIVSLEITKTNFNLELATALCPYFFNIGVGSYYIVFVSGY